MCKAIEGFTNFLDSKEGWVENNISACIDLSNTYDEIGDEENSLRALFRSFEYDEPRAEVCCNIAKHFLEKYNYTTAIYWYQVALSRKLDTESGGFTNRDFYGYIPAIQLCVCYDRLGNREQAIQFNELAAKFKPNDYSVNYNREYFENSK